MVKGLVGMGWSAKSSKPDELAPAWNQDGAMKGTMGKQSRGGGFRPASLAAVSHLHRFLCFSGPEMPQPSNRKATVDDCHGSFQLENL